ncbi:MAG: hypothetical protein RIT81_47320 [Deltaproteobacteria bacterium]
MREATIASSGRTAPRASSGRMALVAVGALTALVGCHEQRRVFLPDLSGRASALLVATGLEGDRQAVSALDLSQDTGGLKIAVGSNDRLFLLAYDDPLDALGLSAGPIDQLGDGLERFLPPTELTFEAAAPERAFEPVAAAELADVFANVRLPSLSRDACAALGCTALVGPQAKAVCRAPCPVDAPEVNPPAPEPAVFATCPEGWERRSPVMAGDVEHCAPAARVTCPPGQIQRAGSAVCEDLGDCSQPGPASVPSGRPVVYVDDDAAAGGDGNAASPYQDLATAYAMAPADAVIAVYAGQYAAPNVALNRNVDFVGNCAAETIVTASPGLVAFDVSAGTVGLAAMSIRSAGGAPTVRATGGALQMTDVEVDGDAFAIAGVGGDVQLERVRVLPGTNMGVYFEGASRALAATDLVVEGRRFVGIRVYRSGSATLTRTIVRGVDGNDDAVIQRGFGIFVQETDAQIRESAVFDARHNAIAIWTSEATLEDVWVELDEIGPIPAMGLDVYGASTMNVTRMSVEGATNGFWIYGDNGGLTGTFSHLRTFETREVGIFAVAGSTVDIDHVVVLRAARSGISVAGASVDLAQFTVLDTRHTDNHRTDRYREIPNASGIRVTGASRLIADDGLIRGVAGVGHETGEEVGATELGEFVRLRGVTIEDAGWGGVHIHRGQTELENVRVKDVGFAGLLAYSNDLQARDVEIDGVTAQPLDLGDDFAPAFVMAARVDEVRLEYRDRNGAGLAVGGFNNLANGAMQVTRARVANAERFGIHLANNSRSVFEQVEIIDAPVGEDVAFGGVVDVGSVFFTGVDTELVVR